ncbi:MAG: tandem-95 repeat protein [Acidobacteriota bacterium]|nr:tandem-95 repeat protein [Acidobacteriota bacterium]
MDNSKQAIVAPFNLKAYGLVNHLLHNNVPVLWAIRAGKAKDGVDFTATAQRLYPSAQAAANLSFSGGPFIVHRDYAAVAKPLMTAFGNNVAVYEMTADATIDIRYQLTHKPRIALLNNGGNASIHQTILDLAGIPNYQIVASAASLGTSSCYTLASEAHWLDLTATATVAAVRQFIQSGGNFFAQCEGVDTYENVGLLQTTAGITKSNVSGGFTYPNADLSYSQFVGELADEGGSFRDWLLSPGSSFQNGGHIHVRNTGGSQQMVATAAKLRTGTGGMVFMLGSHNYANTQDLPHYNGLRMYLNAVMTPADRPLGCGLELTVNRVELILTMTVNNPTPSVGDTVVYTLTLTNNGPDVATNVTVTDQLPSGLTFSSYTASQGTYNSSTGVWTVGNLPVNATVTLVLRATVNAGTTGRTLNNSATATASGQCELNLTNNTDSEPITITAPNRPPDAVNDSYGATEDTTLVVGAMSGVLSNDTDPDGDLLTVTSTGAINTARGGTVMMNANGSFSYSPPANYCGQDSFAYTISDGRGGTDTATVTVNVTCVNDPPDAVNDNASTNEDTPVTINVLSNDTDVDGNPLSVTGASDPPRGSVTINGNGTITYTPDANLCGQDSFTYTISDGRGGTDTATVTVNVVCVNDPPVANDDTTGTNEGTPVVINVLSNDSDVDGNLDPTSVSITVNPRHGTVTVNPVTGAVTYTPNPGFNGIDTFTYRVCDNGGACDTAVVTIGVNSVDDPPVANDDSAVTNEDTPVMINVALNDTDLDGNLNVGSVTVTVNPGRGTVSVNPATGVVTYTPNPNFHGVDTFTYRICDTTSLCDTAVVTVTIRPVNDPPDAVNDSYNATEDTTLTVSAAQGVLANDVDVDGNPLTVTSTGFITTTRGGTVSMNANGSFSYDPPANFCGQDSFTYTISDGQGGTDTATVTLNVACVNDPPVANDDTRGTSENTPVVINVLSNDSDVDGNLDPTSVSITVNPRHGTVTVNPVTGAVTYMPNAGFNGTDTFTYRVCDTNGACDTALVTVIVDSTNDPPVANNDSATTPQGTPVTINVLANDTDVDGVLVPASVTIVSGPAHGTVSVNPVTGQITYTPNPNFYGTDTFVYRVCDNEGACDTATVQVTVTQLPADLVVTKVVDNPAPDLGETITYTITVTNLGPGFASGVEVTERLPSGVTFISAEASQGSYDQTTHVWLVGRLANGESAVLRITVRVNLNATSATITNTVVASANQPDPAPANNTSSVDIGIEAITPPKERATHVHIVFQTPMAPRNGPQPPYPDNQGLLIADYRNDQVRVLLSNGNGTFRVGQQVSVGDGPCAIAVGDFNNDGYTDAVTANQLSGDLSILLGRGDGTFRVQRVLAAGKQPSAVVVGDFNGDDNLDIAVTNAGEDNIVLWLGQGNGAFRAGRSYNTGKQPFGLVVGDLDQDGTLDLATSNFGSENVTVLRGTGRGTFTRITNYLTGKGPLAIVAGDLDQDGRLDLVTADFISNEVSILHNNGRSGFSVMRRLPGGSQRGPIAMATDRFVGPMLGIATANIATGEIAVYIGPIDRSNPMRPQTYRAFDGPASIATGDFNNDGRQDISILDADGITLGVLLSTSDNKFKLTQ